MEQVIDKPEWARPDCPHCHGLGVRLVVRSSGDCGAMTCGNCYHAWLKEKERLGPQWDGICACMGGNRVIQNDGHLLDAGAGDDRIKWHMDHVRRRYEYAAKLKKQEKTNAALG